MTNIYGSVGYTILRNKYNTILVMADVHSKLSYCDNKIDVSDWFKENMNIKNILLEEVPRDGVELNELFKESEHTQKLKNLFLQNSKLIHAIDIRPYLIPFSWEMCKLQDENKSCEFTLEKYLENLDIFFNFKDTYIQNNLSLVYSKKYLMTENKLGEHFIELYKIFESYKKENNMYMKKSIIEIFNNKTHRILDEFNNILDSIMEWFIIAKMFQLKYNKKNVIIHTGLYHSKNIIDKLIESYDYSIIDVNGINSIEEINKYDNYSGCVSLSNYGKNQLSIINI
jgi:hypothetical protein